MWLGKGCPDNTIRNISWCDSFVKSLGIYFSKNKMLSTDMNWSQERYLKVQRILDSWKQRNLSIKGKIVILKTLIISRLVYTAQVLSCPKKWTKAYEQLFYKFLWRNSIKVKKENMINSIINGGMNMFDIHTQFDSLRLKWLFTFLSCRDSDDKKGKWKIPFEYWLEEVGGIDVIMNSKCSPKYVNLCKGAVPDFYCDMLHTWLTVKQVDRIENDEPSYNNIIREPIWLNNAITFKRNVLMFKSWVRSGIFYIGDIVGKKGFLDVNELRCKVVHRDGRWLSEYTKIISAIPLTWRHILLRHNDNQTVDNTFDTYRQKHLTYSNVILIKNVIQVKCVSVKQIYMELVKLKQLPSRAMEFWNNI